MKALAVPLSKLSLSQKLQLLESIWEDLARVPQQVDSPEWHGEILDDRRKALDSGSESLGDWEQAKKRIRKKTKCG